MAGFDDAVAAIRLGAAGHADQADRGPRLVRAVKSAHSPGRCASRRFIPPHSRDVGAKAKPLRTRTGGPQRAALGELEDDAPAAHQYSRPSCFRSVLEMLLDLYDASLAGRSDRHQPGAASVPRPRPLRRMRRCRATISSFGRRQADKRLPSSSSRCGSRPSKASSKLLAARLTC